jgi:hypothetical protein
MWEPRFEKKYADNIQASERHVAADTHQADFLFAYESNQFQKNLQH